MKFRRFKNFYQSLLYLLLLILFTGKISYAQDKYLVRIVVELDTVNKKEIKEFKKLFERKNNVNVDFNHKEIGQIQNALKAKEFDLAICSIGVARYSEYEPVAEVIYDDESTPENRFDDLLRCAIIVNAESNIRDFPDLRGKIVLCVDPELTTGYIYQKNYLEKEWGITDDIEFDKRGGDKHQNVVLNVAAGLYDAGAVYNRAWRHEKFPYLTEEEHKDLESRIRILMIPNVYPSNVAIWRNPECILDPTVRKLEKEFFKIFGYSGYKERNREIPEVQYYIIEPTPEFMNQFRLLQSQHSESSK